MSLFSVLELYIDEMQQLGLQETDFFTVMLSLQFGTAPLWWQNTLRSGSTKWLVKDYWTLAPVVASLVSVALSILRRNFGLALLSPRAPY